LPGGVASLQPPPPAPPAAPALPASFESGQIHFRAGTPLKVDTATLELALR